METEVNTKQSEKTLFDVAEFLKVLGDPTRVKIVWTLYENKELCVGDIVKLMDVSRTAVSHQLRILKNHRIVNFRKDGQMKYYYLDDHHVEEIILLTVTHLTHL